MLALMKRFAFLRLFLAGAALAVTCPALASEGGGHGGGHGGGKSESAVAKPAYGIRPNTSGSETFVQFMPAAATTFYGLRPAGQMHFEYGLDIKNAAMRKRAIAMAPRLRAAYGKILAQYAGSLYSPGEVPDIDYLATRMQSATDRILGKGRATFLIATLMVQ